MDRNARASQDTTADFKASTEKSAGDRRAPGLISGVILANELFRSTTLLAPESQEVGSESLETATVDAPAKALQGLSAGSTPIRRKRPLIGHAPSKGNISVPASAKGDRFRARISSFASPGQVGRGLRCAWG